MSNSYFLSDRNPVATVDQRDLEGTALRLLGRPELQKARSIATVLWRQVMAYPAAEQMSRFAGMVDEYVFHYALRAANSDACYPKVLRIMQPPAQWFGRDVPGSRWGGDSPDFIYRIVPITHGARYEISGRATCKDPPTVTYALMTNTASPGTLGVLDSRDVPVDKYGEFIITIDPTPADGRANHLQTQPGEYHLLVRDALGDWLTQTPNALRVRRLDEPDRAPLSDEVLAQHAAKSLLEGLYFTYYCTQSGSGQAPNSMRSPSSSGVSGGLATQWSTKGNVLLAADEALIVTANAAGAVFRNVVLCDFFFMSLNYWSRTGSLNMNQMAADDDGCFTYVVAHQDPGVYNWLDTGGLRRTIFGHRWQVLPRDGSAEAPFLSARTVKFKELETTLPPGARSIDGIERREQIARREAGFKRRFVI